MSNLEIRTVSLAKIRPYAKNAKTHSDEQIRQLANSIQEFGLNSPFLVDENNEIIAGHGRFAAAQLLGLDEVPVIQLSHLSDAQKRAYRLADNKIAENGGWNEELLKLELSELEISCDFDIQLTGFSTIEIDVMQNEKSAKGEPDEKANAVTFVPAEEVITKPGDLWLIGNHRLLCGSSLEEANFEKLMDGKLVDLISTDPPYNIDSKTIGLSGKHQHPDFQMAAGEMDQAQFTKFLTDVFVLNSKFAKKNALAYLWMDWRHLREILAAGDVAFGSMINLAVWSKPAGNLGRLYRPRHELCLIFHNGDKQYCDNVEFGKNGRYRTNVWEFGSVGAGIHKTDALYHPTVKPQELIKEIFLDASPRGGLVLDCFMGSGTSLIAAEKSKRICYGLELDPKYVDTAIRRFQDLFKVDAIHAETGSTYNELLAQRKNG